MRGHQALLQMRLRGQRPADVFVNVLAEPAPRQGFLDAEDITATIDVEPADVVGLLDLRQIRGCRVHVIGRDESRVRSIAKHLRTFEPSEILAAGFGDAILRWRPKP